MPFHGEDALVQKHYVSKLSLRQKGMLAFLTHDADTHVFCYANGQLRTASTMTRFSSSSPIVNSYRQVPQNSFSIQAHHVCNLNLLNHRSIDFLTLRRRSQKILATLAHLPASAWRLVELQNVSRAYRRPRVLDDKIQLKGYDGPLRQLTVADLGHEEPTLLLTNQMRRAASTLIERYAQLW